ncbi:MAG TPA: glycosyltransferase family 4 protein [Ktedonobacterales bacterium]|nr:glycosyltransferase family 4 protein [Ktedonobacterales bacterium]
MRILHVHPINQVAQQYMDGLARLGHTGTLYEPSLAGGGAALPLKLAMMPGRIFHMSQIVGDLNSAHYDLAHIHWASYGVLGLASRIPYIVHCHGSDVRERLKTPAARILLTPILRRAAAVLCITPDLLPVVQGVISDARFFPAPVDASVFTPPPDEMPPRPWTVLLFARLEPGKGVEVAAQGVAHFAERHPEVRVCLLDYGVLSAEYRQRYGGRFDFLPRVPPDEVPNLLRRVDGVVGQFAVGALGLSELQAMSCARPVIASFRYPEAYAAPPPLYQATTAEEVDAQLEFIFQHPQEAKDVGEQARAWIRVFHDAEALAKRLEGIYTQTLGQAA